MGRTSNPVQYLDFGDSISLLGMLRYIPILWGPTARAKFFTAFFLYFLSVETVCCFGDIIKENCRRIVNIARTLRYPPSGEP